MQQPDDPLAKSHFEKAAGNLGWLVGERAVRFFFTVVVGFFVARHLGPERFGMLGYCLAIVTLLGIVPALGLDPVVKRELLETPENTGAILAGSFGLRLIGGVGAYAALLAVVLTGHGGNAEERRLLAVLGLLLFQPALLVPDLWLQAQLQAKRSVWAQTAALTVAAALRVVLVWRDAPLAAFAWVAVLEFALTAAGIARLSGRSVVAWTLASPRRREMRRLLREAWPLIFANLAIVIYMKTDEVMLRQMAGPAAVGIYAAATRLTEIWYFFPVALASSLLPGLLRSRRLEPAAYRLQLQRYYDLNAAIAYAISIPIALAAPWIIRIAYGAPFAGAAPIVAVHVWSSIFVFIGVARGQWLVNERLQKFYLGATVAGAALNILLNLCLIPRWGGVGAAVATVISQAAAAWLSSFASDATRETGRMQTRALLLPVFGWRYLPFVSA